MANSNDLLQNVELEHKNHYYQEENQKQIVKNDKNAVMEIGVRMRIDEVEEISTSNQKYTVKGVYEKDWPPTEQDQENWKKFLDPNNNEVTEYIPEAEPSVGWVNCCEYPTYFPLLWTETKSQYRIDEKSGKNQARWDIRAVWTEEFEVESFPFDVQDLTMVFCSEDMPSTKAKLCYTSSHNPSLTVDKTWSPITHFEIDNIDINFEEVDYLGEGNPRDIYIYGRYRIQVNRKWKGIVYRIIVWMFMLGLLSWTTFGIDYQSIGDRMGFSMTMVLTVVAFQFVISNELPKVNYLTFLDKYNLFIFGYVVLICFESVITGWHGSGASIKCMKYLEDDVDSECRLFYAEYYDNMLAIIFGVLYVCGNIGWIFYAVYLNRIENAKLGNWEPYELEQLTSKEKEKILLANFNKYLTVQK
eukprot:207270_1